MTCIVGLEADGHVFIGGDSAGVDERTYAVEVRSDEKVFVRRAGTEAYAFGFCGSFRLGQLLRYKLELPVPEEDEDLYEFLATRFVDAVRQAAEDGGTLRQKHGLEDLPDSDFLLGFRGELFTVYGDLQVARSVNAYNSVGCGAQLALGALYATESQSMTPEERVLLSLQVATRGSGGVRPPYTVVTTAPPALEKRARARG